MHFCVMLRNFSGASEAFGTLASEVPVIVLDESAVSAALARMAAFYRDLRGCSPFHPYRYSSAFAHDEVGCIFVDFAAAIAKQV